MDLEQLLERAHSLGEESEWELMADLLREHLSDFKDEPAVHCWLGVAERELGLEGVAYERFKRAITLEPAAPYVLATAGNGIAAFDDEDAERVLRTAALTAPDLPLTRLMYGTYLSREGFHEQAEAELDVARALEPAAGRHLEEAPARTEPGGPTPPRPQSRLVAVLHKVAQDPPRRRRGRLAARRPRRHRAAERAATHPLAAHPSAAPGLRASALHQRPAAAAAT